MKDFKSGFTLIELLVTILAASIVTLGAISVMLFALRTERAAHSAAAEQQNIRVVSTLLDQMANSGSIQSAKVSAESEDGWALYSSTGTLLEYKGHTLYISSGSILLDGITQSFLSTNDGGTLLTVSITAKSGETYEVTIYCRVQTISE